MENNMSFPNSPNNDIRHLTMSPVPGSTSPNRNSGYNSDSNLHHDTIIMPPPVEDSNLDGINLLANPKVAGGLDSSPIGSPKQSVGQNWHDTNDNNNENNNEQSMNYNDNNNNNFNNFNNFNGDAQNDDLEQNEEDYYPTRPNPGMSPEEMLNRKQEILFQFDKLQRRGFTLPRKYTLRDDLDFLEFEYEKIKKQREVESSIQFSRKMLMACITGVEYLNGKFDPFDVNLEGWSESIMENINDYDDVFEELHDKYKSKVKVAPEIRLMLMLGGSAFMFHLTNTMFKSAAPQMSEMFRNNPDLMKSMASAVMGGGGNMSGAMPQGMMPQTMPPMMPQMMPPGMMPPGMMPPGMMQPGMMQPPQMNRSEITEMPPSPEIHASQEVRRVDLGNKDRSEMKGPASLDSLLAGGDPDNLASIQKKRRTGGRKSKTNEINLS
jgi:hypothetical protein